MQSWSTLKLPSNEGSLLTKSLSYKPGGFTSLIKVQRLIYDEPHNLFELPYFDQNVKVFRTGSN